MTEKQLVEKLISMGDAESMGIAREQLKLMKKSDNPDLVAFAKSTLAEIGAAKSKDAVVAEPTATVRELSQLTKDLIASYKGDIDKVDREVLTHRIAMGKSFKQAAADSGVASSTIERREKILVGDHPDLVAEIRENSAAWEADDAKSALRDKSKSALTGEAETPDWKADEEARDAAIDEGPLFAAPSKKEGRLGLEPEKPGNARPPNSVALANDYRNEKRVAQGKEPIYTQAKMSNPEAWDQAMDMLGHNPKAGQELTESLSKDHRIPSKPEHALLLHRLLSLEEEHSESINESLRIQKLAGSGGADAIDVTAAMAKEAMLSAQVDQLDSVITAIGSSAGDVLQFRRQIINERYELSGMVRRASAVKGAPLTEAEKAGIAGVSEKIKAAQENEAAAEVAFKAAKGKPRLTGEEAAALERKRLEIEAGIAKHRTAADGLAAADKSGWTAMDYLEGELPKRLVEAQRETLRSINDYADILDGIRQKAKTPSSWMADALIHLHRMFVISGVGTFAKIVATSASLLGTAPIREAAGSVLKMIPLFAKIAENAPREGAGFNFRNEIKVIHDGLVKGWMDAWQTITTGEAEVDAYKNLAKDRKVGEEGFAGGSGKQSYWKNLIGISHAAGKAPAVRAEMTRSFLNRITREIKAGNDITPEVMLESWVEAYKDGQREKFQSDNIVVDIYRDGIKKLRDPKARGEAQLLGFAAEMALPVVRIPVNIATDIGNYIFGSVIGSARAVNAWTSGLGTLKPHESDAILRQLKKGLIGPALMAIGFALPGAFGGFYSGKRKDDDLQPGQASVFGVTIPAWAMHAPMLQMLEVGATIRRAADESLKGGKNGRVASIAEGIAAGLGGVLHEVPFVSEAKQVVGLTSHDARQRGWELGEMAKSFAIPQLFQWLAKGLDVPGGKTPFVHDPVERTPKTFPQHLQMGIPMMRKNVPTKEQARSR